MNIYDTAHKLAEEIRKSDECVHLAELRERAYADETNRLLLDEYKRAAANEHGRRGGRNAQRGYAAVSAAGLAAVYEQRRTGLLDGGNADAEDAGGYL